MTMENKNMIWHNSMTYGAILGGLLVTFSLIGFVFKLNNATILQILNYISLGALMYYGTKVLRDKYQGGYIGYGRALASSFLITLFAGIIVAFFTLVYFKWLDPNMLEQMKVEVQQTLMDKGMGEKEIEISMRMMTPSFYAFAALFSFAFWGFILSLIVAMFIRKEGNPIDTITEKETGNNGNIEKTNNE